MKSSIYFENYCKIMVNKQGSLNVCCSFIHMCISGILGVVCEHPRRNNISLMIGGLVELPT
jgi:hypothetical protein